jgi:phospholipid transport system substrate-binding protein
MRKLLGAFTLLIAVASTPVSAAQASAAAAYVEKLGNDVLTTISDKSIPQEKKLGLIEGMFRSNVDFDWVGKFVMGRFWREATDDQKKRYLEAYRNFLTKHYTARFSEYTSGSFKITSAKELEKGDSEVSMEIMSGAAGDPPVVIDYKIRKVGGNYKVYDITVEGVSLITTQRQEFGSVLNDKGIEGLISSLNSK